MADVMLKAKNGDKDILLFRCPGCNDNHQVSVGPLGAWGWNGSLTKPTLEGSVLVQGGSDNVICHSFITDGRILFLQDSTHALSGQEAELPEWRPERG